MICEVKNANIPCKSPTLKEAKERIKCLPHAGNADLMRKFPMLLFQPAHILWGLLLAGHGVQIAGRLHGEALPLGCASCLEQVPLLKNWTLLEKYCEAFS